MNDFDLAVRIEKKREDMIKKISFCKSLEEIMNVLNISRQRFYQILNYLELDLYWHKHISQYKKVFIDSPKSSGVYCLYFIQEPKKKYYGSSKNIYVRLCNHLSNLSIGTKTNTNLQDLYDKYGKESLRFDIIKIVSPDRMLKDEADAVRCDPNNININKNLMFSARERYLHDYDRRKKIKGKLPKFKSKYKYVHWNYITQSWKVYVTDKKLKKQIFLGYFKSEIDAKNKIDEYFKFV
jgi:hypothetical protein